MCHSCFSLSSWKLSFACFLIFELKSASDLPLCGNRLSESMILPANAEFTLSARAEPTKPTITTREHSVVSSDRAFIVRPRYQTRRGDLPRKLLRQQRP